MPAYEPEELDVLSRAFYRAVEALPKDGRDAEEAKAILMTGILDAASRGVRDENRLCHSALAAVADYEGKELEAVVQETPL
jgi:hypothetical protein